MNRSTHALIGGAVGGIVYLAACKLFNEDPEWGKALLSIGAGATVACLHDILEPATHPNHRAFFHSIAFNGSVAFAVWRVGTDRTIHPTLRRVVVTIGLSFLSHPVVDVTTPKGLPIA